MTNLEVLEQFNEIAKPYLEAHPDMGLFDLLFWVNSYCKDKSDIGLLERSDSFALDTIERYIIDNSKINKI